MQQDEQQHEPVSEEQQARLTAGLEQMLLRELLSEWKRINHVHFRGLLRPAAIELSQAQTRLGQWNSATRTIAIGRSTVISQPWGVVVEVLKHEMAHQYVSDVLKVTEETAHGKAFRGVCERLGIDATAAGLPGAPAPAAEHRVIERVARLLALAESSNRHEAEAAMAAAQRLMLKYNLSECEAETTRSYSFRHVGRPTGRVCEHERILSVILCEHFFVEVIWVPVYRPLEGKMGSVLEICGSQPNLEMAEYVHTFLAHTAERLWFEHKTAAQIRADRDRRVFLAGVMTGFREKLQGQTREHQEQGLVWVGDAVLQEFYRRRHPYIRHTRHQGQRRNAAWSHGREAGREIVIHRPVQAASSDQGRLLGAGRRSSS